MEARFHEGELAVQARAGVGGIAEEIAGFVRDHLPDQHRAFHTGLPFLVAGARDADDRIWATILEGPEGFVTSPDPRTLEIASHLGADDPLSDALEVDADIGLLGIELDTRRRNRINGRVTRNDRGLTFAVDQAFGNCPQYIHPRRVTRDGAVPGAVARSDRLSDEQAARIRAADTFFIATGYPGDRGAAQGLDASHRGGPAGFITVSEEGRTLRFPDYSGNNFFNTLGNLEKDPRAGLVFIDFDTGGLLHLTGRITIDWSDDPASDARRHLDMEIDAVVDRPGALALRWGSSDVPLRRLRLVEKTVETDQVTSFTFAAEDGTPLPDAEPGQHLPIQIHAKGHSPMERSYSLSGPPGTGCWRISVKREPQGTVSRMLHDDLEVGDGIAAMPPSGAFGPEEDGPLVLISAGIGLTPMLAHLHVAAATGRDAWFIHGARSNPEHAMAEEVREIVGTRPHLHARVAYSDPDAQDVGHDWTGRLTTARVIEETGPVPDASYLLCGPQAFVSALEKGLLEHGIAPARIHVETF